MFLQLVTLGRGAMPAFLGSGFDVVSASDIPMEGGAVPRPLSIEEVRMYAEDYVKASRIFVHELKGDGVEVHVAHGDLLEQFLSTRSNARTDSYGGSVQNRSRCTLEVLDAIVQAVGAKRVGIRFAPFSTYAGTHLPDSMYARLELRLIYQMSRCHSQTSSRPSPISLRRSRTRIQTWRTCTSSSLAWPPRRSETRRRASPWTSS